MVPIVANGPVQCESSLLELFIVCSLRSSLMDGLSARHSAHLFVKTSDIQSSSPQPRTHTQKADSGTDMERAWCDECGCGIWIKSQNMSDLTFLKAGKGSVLSLHFEYRTMAHSAIFNLTDTYCKGSSIQERFPAHPWRIG